MRKLLLSILFCVMFAAVALGEDVTITGTQIKNAQLSGSVCYYRLFASGNFTDSLGVRYLGSSPSFNASSYISAPCSVAGNTATIGSFTLPSTLDSIDNKTVRYTAVLYNSGKSEVARYPANFAVPSSPTTTTWNAIILYNAAPQRAMPLGYYTNEQVDDIFGTLTSAAQKANEVQIGVVRLATAPDSVNDPLAIGANDASVTSKLYVDKYANLADLLDESIVLSKAPVTAVIASNESVTATNSSPANVTYEFTNGGKITVSAGQTFTINGNITAPADKQIFAGPGTVSLASSKTLIIYPEWFGAAGDYVAPTALVTNGVTTTDDRAAITAALAAAPQGATVQLAAKNYRIVGGSIDLTKQVKLVGQGRGFWSSGGLALTEFGTALYFDTNSHGIVINSTAGAVAEVENLSVSPASWAKVTTAARHGIWMKSRAAVRNVTSVRWSGSAIYIGSSVTENANLWEVYNVLVCGNNQHGLHLPLVTDEGGQTENNNSGTAIKVDARDNTLDGIFDESLHGNYFLGHHASYNGRYGFHTKSFGTQDTIFVGGYEENNVSAAYLNEGSNAGTLVLGGTHSPPVSPSGGLFITKNISTNEWTVRVRETASDTYTEIASTEIRHTTTGGRVRFINVPSVGVLQEAMTSGGVWQLKNSAGTVFFSQNITGANAPDLPVGVTIGTGTKTARIKHGVCTLTAGVCTVTETTVSANSRIFPQSQTDGGTPGLRYAITRTAGASFVITAKDGSNATQTLDTSTVAWQLIEP